MPWLQGTIYAPEDQAEVLKFVTNNEELDGSEWNFATIKRVQIFGVASCGDQKKMNRTVPYRLSRQTWPQGSAFGSFHRDPHTSHSMSSFKLIKPHYFQNNDSRRNNLVKKLLHQLPSPNRNKPNFCGTTKVKRRLQKRPMV